MIDLVSRVNEKLLERRTRQPCHVNRASALGGDCERQLVYQRLDWDKGTLPDLRLLSIFRLGEVHERDIRQLLEASGFDVYSTQQSLWDHTSQISGHCDGLIDGEDGAVIVLEIKSMSDNIWRTVAKRGTGTYRWDMVSEAFTTRPWLRKYFSQIQLYMWMLNTRDRTCNEGILLCVNKTTGELAQINCALDLDFLDPLLERANRINRYVAREEYPPRIPFDDTICPRCNWYTSCWPDRVGRDPILFLDGSIIEADLDLCRRTQDERDAHERAMKRVKEWAKAITKEKASAGWREYQIALPGWLITCKRSGEGKPIFVTYEPLGQEVKTDLADEEPFG